MQCDLVYQLLYVYIQAHHSATNYKHRFPSKQQQGGRVSKGPSVALPNSLLRRRLHTPQRKLSAGSTNKAGLLQM